MNHAGIQSTHFHPRWYGFPYDQLAEKSIREGQPFHFWRRYAILDLRRMHFLIADNAAMMRVFESSFLDDSINTDAAQNWLEWTMDAFGAPNGRDMSDAIDIETSYCQEH